MATKTPLVEGYDALKALDLDHMKKQLQEIQQTLDATLPSVFHDHQKQTLARCQAVEEGIDRLIACREMAEERILQQAMLSVKESLKGRACEDLNVTDFVRTEGRAEFSEDNPAYILVEVTYHAEDGRSCIIKTSIVK